MKISVISFTGNGIQLSKKLADVWEHLQTQAGWEELILFTKCSAASGTGDTDKSKLHSVSYVETGIEEWAGQQMRERNILLFIGACGIAVRAIAPHLTDKLHDSPVLVMDERGKYVIPILSGHVGGANDVAHRIAKVMGAVPVITTATDINHKFAVDIFAKANELSIINKEGIAKVSSKVLAGKDITISIETGHIREDCGLPAGVHRIPYPPRQSVDVAVTSDERNFDAAILLRPREYVIGMGCRRGKETEKIEAFILRSMREAGIETEQLLALASIEQKKEEQGFLSWSRKNQVPFVTYTAEQLKETEGEFHTSDFVMKKMGVDNVCERAALRACGASGRIVYAKHAEDGMTIAIARREWSVSFDEE